MNASNLSGTSNTLESIQILAKIGRIISQIVFICCIIGAAGCAVGMLSLPFAETGVFKIGGVSIHGLIVNRAGVDLNGLYPLMTGGLLLCTGYAVAARLAQRYFHQELAEGTPFTLSGAQSLLWLGIWTIFLPLGSQILAQIVSDILAQIIGSGEAFHPEGGDSVALGVMFIVMSRLCKYGAECKTAHAVDPR